MRDVFGRQDDRLLTLRAFHTHTTPADFRADSCGLQRVSGTKTWVSGEMNILPQRSRLRRLTVGMSTQRIGEQGQMKQRKRIRSIVDYVSVLHFDVIMIVHCINHVL